MLNSSLTTVVSLFSTCTGIWFDFRIARDLICSTTHLWKRVHLMLVSRVLTSTLRHQRTGKLSVPSLSSCNVNHNKVKSSDIFTIQAQTSQRPSKATLTTSLDSRLLTPTSTPPPSSPEWPPGASLMTWVLNYKKKCLLLEKYLKKSLSQTTTHKSSMMSMKQPSSLVEASAASSGLNTDWSQRVKGMIGTSSRPASTFSSSIRWWPRPLWDTSVLLWPLK